MRLTEYEKQFLINAINRIGTQSAKSFCDYDPNKTSSSDSGVIELFFSDDCANEIVSIFEKLLHAYLAANKIPLSNYQIEIVKYNKMKKSAGFFQKLKYILFDDQEEKPHLTKHKVERNLSLSLMIIAAIDYCCFSGDIFAERRQRLSKFSPGKSYVKIDTPQHRKFSINVDFFWDLVCHWYLVNARLRSDGDVNMPMTIGKFSELCGNIKIILSRNKNEKMRYDSIFHRNNLHHFNNLYKAVAAIRSKIGNLEGQVDPNSRGYHT